MPVEVRELIITARVEDKKPAGSNHPVKMQAMNDRDLQKIVALCAEQVMDIIKRQNER
jgi:hypothetical protein